MGRSGVARHGHYCHWYRHAQNGARIQAAPIRNPRGSSWIGGDAISGRETPSPRVRSGGSHYGRCNVASAGSGGLGTRTHGGAVVLEDAIITTVGRMGSDCGGMVSVLFSHECGPIGRP